MTAEQWLPEWKREREKDEKDKGDQIYIMTEKDWTTRGERTIEYTAVG